MRVVKEIPHPQFKITVFSWNGKFLVKVESGMYEQTYKFSEQDVMSDDEITKLVDEEFLTAVTASFKNMHTAARSALNRL